MSKIDFSAVVNGLLNTTQQASQAWRDRHNGGKSQQSGNGNGAGGGQGGIQFTNAEEGANDQATPGGPGGSMTGDESGEASGDSGNQTPTTMSSTPSTYGSSGTAEPVYQVEGEDTESPDLWGAIVDFFTGGSAAADEGADEIEYYDPDGTVAAEGDNDYIAVVDTQIQDAIDNGDMLNGVDLDEYGINPEDVNWTSIAWMPAGQNVYGRIYGTDTVYDSDGNEYVVLSDEANAARANDLFYLYSLEGNQEIFGDNWTTDRDVFQQHYDNTISTEELLSDFDQYAYQYAYGDDQAIRELATLIAASEEPYYLGGNNTYDMREMYQNDPEAYVNNIEAILAQGAMESAGLSDIVDYMNGEYEGDLTIDELQQQAADRLGWREGDLNALTDNENIEYGTGDGWGRNVTEHRGDPIADQYNSDLDDDWLRRSAENPSWNSEEYEAPLPVQNMSDNVFAIYDGMSY